MLKLLWRDFQDKCILPRKDLIARTVISFMYKGEKIKLYIDLLLHHRERLRDFQADRTIAATWSESSSVSS